LHPQFAAQQLLLRVANGSSVGNLVDQVFELPLRRAVLCAGAISPQVVQTEVGNNAIDPGRDRALKAEATELFVDLYECFLMDILSNVVRAGDTLRESQNGLVVDVHQFLKSGVISGLRRPNQGVILSRACTLHHRSPRCL
jgi:hypothetical protein